MPAKPGIDSASAARIVGATHCFPARSHRGAAAKALEIILGVGPPLSYPLCQTERMNKPSPSDAELHKNEVHGDHWQAALPDHGPDDVEAVLHWVCREGKMAGEAGFDFPLPDGCTRPETVYALIHPDTPLRYLLLVISDTSRGERQNEVASGYPCMDGCVNRIRVDALTPWANGIEGLVHGTSLGGASVSFFDPDFYKNRARYQPGQAYDFSVSALAYQLARAESDTLTITEGPMIQLEQERALAENPAADISQITSVEVSLAELRCLIGDDRIPDNAEFRTVVEEVGYFEVEGIGYYRLRGILMRPEEQNFEGYLYVAETALAGYRPQKGDSVEGSLWLQARLVADTAYPFPSEAPPARATA